MSTFNNGKAVLLSFTAFSKMIIYHPKQTEMVLINFYFVFIFLSSFLDDTSIEIMNNICLCIYICIDFGRKGNSNDREIGHHQYFFESSLHLQGFQRTAVVLSKSGQLHQVSSTTGKVCHCFDFQILTISTILVHVVATVTVQDMAHSSSFKIQT